MEIKDVTRCAFMAPDPKLMTVDFNKIEAFQKQTREEREKNNPPKTEGPAKELAGLRRELFNLTERAKSCETFANNKAGEVKLREQWLAEAINKKKEAVANGNERAERNYEHSIQRLESELADSEKEFHRARKVSLGAANDLKNWPHRERVKELEQSLA